MLHGRDRSCDPGQRYRGRRVQELLCKKQVVYHLVPLMHSTEVFVGAAEEGTHMSAPGVSVVTTCETTSCAHEDAVQQMTIACLDN